MDKVKDYLRDVKANRYTYYNLDKQTIADYQKLYAYLKRHTDKFVISPSPIWKWCVINKYKYTEYVYKYKLMELIAHYISHKINTNKKG